MGFVLVSARKDLLRRLRDPAALVVWLGIPFVILTMMTLAFGSGFGGGPRKIQAHLLLVDADEPWLCTTSTTRRRTASSGMSAIRRTCTRSSPGAGTSCPPSGRRTA